MKSTGTLIVTTTSDREIVMTRDFNAPRNMVWDAMSKPDLLMRWLSGPPGWAMTACEDELKMGGAFRWVWRSADGPEMAMRGVYREVVPPERVVRTESFENACDAKTGEQLGTLVLTEQSGGGGGGGGGGRTTLTLTLLYPSKEARDGAIASGMECGMAAGYDRLEKILATTPSLRDSRNAA